ncbi:hypothetical protein JK361_09735 [Streptomyces sp. 5-8]|uniref:MmyB-like transcription regulator ligand binding domain-containing protein n=1 Tax=Streptomyces musisoli TaxID=2802280 RepID=A0ABS1NXN1_9ACTN|nr:hypothetical protein [Streptomyces musisoli]
MGGGLRPPVRPGARGLRDAGAHPQVLLPLVPGTAARAAVTGRAGTVRRGRSRGARRSVTALRRPRRPAPRGRTPRCVLDRLYDSPAQVVTDCGTVLAQNALAKALVGDALARPPRERNLTRRFFLDPAARALFPPEDLPAHARNHVVTLRAVAAARPDDPEPAARVAELRSSSEEFARLWDAHEVPLRRQTRKRFVHPVVGLLELDCEVLLSHANHHHLILHTARPGTESHDRLQLLRVVGLQDMTPRPTNHQH